MSEVRAAPRKKSEILPERVEAYLRAHGHPSAALISLVPLGADVQEGLKAHGYGRPLCATFAENGAQKRVVVRTMSADQYGHDRRSDRIGNMTLCYDEFNAIPKHVKALDVGVFSRDGSLLSVAEGEPFLVTEYADGELYAHDLKRMARLAVARPLDVDRAEALARYLAELHSVRASPAEYRRSIRDTVGSGEGIFGLTDGYPDHDTVATRARLETIELACIAWRWRLRGCEDRACRTHGDFHPFNLLFRAGVDLSVLDTSRGGAGDPADDVSCLTINYLFFALDERGRFDGALREVWDVFYRTYLELTRDDALPEVMAPFFTWRALVLASPAWYPDVAPSVRNRILSFAERLLQGKTFTPERVDDLL